MSGTCLGRWFWVVLAGFGMVLAGPAEAPGQGVGPGSSPGRAAYRPEWQWNNGPYQAVGHWDPYAPHAFRPADLLYSEPIDPPFSNQPRALYGTYDPARPRLQPYAQGFSPFAGYAPWFQKEHRFTPSRRDLVEASGLYFRSSPIPPDPRYLAPGVAQALYGPAPPAQPVGPRTLTPAAAVAPRLELPKPPEQPVNRRTVLYRFGPEG